MVTAQVTADLLRAPPLGEQPGDRRSQLAVVVDAAARLLPACVPTRWSAST
jgi:hypothetical protein